MSQNQINDVNLPFMKYDDSVKSGETTATIDGVFQRTGKFNKYSANVTLDDGRKVQLSVNDSSIALMVSYWGNDPSKWLQNELRFELVKTDKSPTGSMKMWRPIKSEVQWKE